MVPVPEFRSNFAGQWMPKLVSKHADLAAMMRFVGQHVAKHPQAPSVGNRPGFRQRIPLEKLNAAIGFPAQCFG
jgi:hypothetical protein